MILSFILLIPTRKMGMCFANNNNLQQRNKVNAVYQVGENSLNVQEKFVLKLIYNDLKQRIPQQAINLQNFLLFFHKNGFWGTRLFQQFTSGSDFISQQEFLAGMGKFTKTDQNKKIQLLFRFFSSSSPLPHHQFPERIFPDEGHSIQQQRNQPGKQQGVSFDQFLVMLYNYPKEDLKQILNDRQFFQTSLKHSLISIGENRRLQSVYSSGQLLNKNNHIIFRFQEKEQPLQSGSCSQTEILPSMVGRDILKQLKQRETDQTTLRLDDGETTLEVRTNNIHYLVKKFAKSIFKQQHLDLATGKLNIGQFTQWIKNHNTLYRNYYQGFHNDFWEYDLQADKCKFLLSPSEKEDVAKYQCGEKFVKCYLLLKQSFIAICEQVSKSELIDVICLEGLQVSRVFEENKGFGFVISHRDGLYCQKRIFFKNQSIRNDWNESLKYFKGDRVENLYTMGKKIGTGKFSVVYEATSKQNNSKVAIKVIQYKQLDITARRLIAHQSSIMQIFSHPLLVQFKGCLQTKSHLYIITQLCPGRDLFELVKDLHQLGEVETAAIIQQVIVGVRYLHSLGIVHRDLKPENIMVDFDFRQRRPSTVKIIDFGFANYLSAFEGMANDEALAGTPNYIAPELLRGEGISFKSDNFAIGSILYFMLSGNLPFNSESLSDIFVKTLECKYSFRGKYWERVSRNAKDLIDGFLQTDPEMRLSLEEALTHPWFKEIKNKSLKSTIDKQTASSENVGFESTRATSN